ncbi:MAG: helix-turn-helix transcriptional regulator [Pseudonocardiaceae bacterium]
MALSRQGLSQRRRAAGLTQEALAQRLGVQRCTVICWEAGDTEPPSAVRPELARILDMTIHHLAELLTETKYANTARTFSAGTGVTIPARLPLGAAELGRPAGIARPADTADVEVDTPIPITGGVVESDPAQPEILHRPAATAILMDVKRADVHQRRAKSQRFTWFAAAGVLAVVLAEGAASVPFIAAHRGPVSPVAGNSVPVAAIPAPEPGSDNSLDASTGIVDTAPVAAPIKPDTATSGAAIAPARRANRSKPPAAPASQRTSELPAEFYEAWSRMAALSGNDQGKTRRRPGSSSHR